MKHKGFSPLWLASRYAIATRQVAETKGIEGWRLLREYEMEAKDHYRARDTDKIRGGAFEGSDRSC